MKLCFLVYKLSLYDWKTIFEFKLLFFALKNKDMHSTQFVFNSELKNIERNIFQWSAPSNIALIKYWGKKEHQIPENPSLSFTLNNCKTITKLEVRKKVEKGISFDLLFDGQPKESFRPKIQKFLERILPYCSYLEVYHLEIDTKNTFPHSSGIASSAYGMAALAVTIMQLER